MSRKYIYKKSLYECWESCKSSYPGSTHITFSPEGAWANDCLCTPGTDDCSSWEPSHAEAYHIYKCQESGPNPTTIAPITAAAPTPTLPETTTAAYGQSIPS